MNRDDEGGGQPFTSRCERLVLVAEKDINTFVPICSFISALTREHRRFPSCPLAWVLPEMKQACHGFQLHPITRLKAKYKERVHTVWMFGKMTIVRSMIVMPIRS